MYYRKVKITESWEKYRNHKGDLIVISRSASYPNQWKIIFAPKNRGHFIKRGFDDLDDARSYLKTMKYISRRS